MSFDILYKIQRLIAASGSEYVIQRHSAESDLYDRCVQLQKNTSICYNDYVDFRCVFALWAKPIQAYRIQGRNKVEKYAGMGGLSAANFLAKYNKKVLVLEKHHIPGGLVTSFARKGVHFDLGIHGLYELKENQTIP